MSVTLGSLFDGSGGFPLAGSLCGIEPIWASEIEPYPIAVTKSRFPNMKHLGDISKINGEEIEPVDIISFGSPCQDLSVAGLRRGLKHKSNGDGETTRSGLFMEAIRIIKEMRRATNGKHPRFALWENVPGAFSSNKGEDFRIVLEELIKISEEKAAVPPAPKGGWPYADAYVGDGWSLAYRTFDAQYWGVPQRRRRIYLVADFAGGCAPGILFEREGLRGYFTPGERPWEKIASGTQRSIRTNDCKNKTNECVTLSSVASTLRTSAGNPKNVSDCVGRLVLKPVDTANDSDGTIAATGIQSNDEINDCVKNCLTSWDYQTRRVYDSNGKWPTLTAGAITSGQNQQAVLQLSEKATLDGNSYDGAITTDCTVSKTTHTGKGNTESRKNIVCVGTQQGGAEITQNGICPTLTAAAGMSGNNQPWICADNCVDCSNLKPLNTAMGVDGYNGTITGNKSSTLGVNCGTSTGRNGVLEVENAKEYTAFSQNQRNELRDLNGKSGALAAHHGLKQQTYIIEKTEEKPSEIYCMASGQAHAEIYENKCPTLNCTAEQPIVTEYTNTSAHPFVLFEPRSQDGIPRIHDEIAPTLNTAQGGQRQPCVAVSLQQQPFCKSSRPSFKGDSETYIDCKVSNTLNTFDLGDKRANELIVETVPVYCVQGNCIDRADTAGCNGKGWREDASFTLNTIDRPAIVYAVDQGGGKAAANSCSNISPTLTCTHGGEPAIAYAMSTGNFMQVNKDASPTLAARDYKGPHLVGYRDESQIYRQSSYVNYAEGVSGTLKASGGSYGGGSESLVVSQKPQYIVRRLTPTECARLQGFADDWGVPEHKKDLTDDEYQFWLEVRNTHAIINGRNEKEYSKAQILTWYNKLHSASSEYKMWGNGVALPPTLYCLQGIEEALSVKP